MQLMFILTCQNIGNVKLWDSRYPTFSDRITDLISQTNFTVVLELVWIGSQVLYIRIKHLIKMY